MKYSKIFFRSLCALAVAVSATACDDDDLIVGGADTNGYLTPDGNVVYVTDANGNREFTNTEFVNNGSVDLFANSSKPVNGCSVTFSVDPTVLTAYNEANSTSYAQLPDASFTLGNNGQAVFSDGATKSAPMTVTFRANQACEPDVTYALPLRISVSNGQLSQTSVGTRVILVRDLTKRPGADKFVDGGVPAVKTMAVLEVNDRNPLSTLGYTLKNSGKQFFDIVVLFAANINYNAETGRLYISRNENVQALLDGREKYIKPLQDKGMKVVLGVLGNHDASGISTLTPAASKAFAQEAKNICDTYNLDGIFLDDEYTDYDAAANDNTGLFQAYSMEAINRLAYDIKKAQPDRLMIGYKYSEKFGNFVKGVEIEGTQPGEFWDYVCNNYWDTANPCDDFPGLRQNQAGTGSWNCSDWAGCMPAYQNWRDRFSHKKMREDGYGIMMIFNFYNDPGHWLTPYIHNWLASAAVDFYDDELIIPDDVYVAKDY